MRSCLLAAIAALTPATAFAQDALEREQCLEDLQFVVETISDNHPNIYYRISEDRFADAVNEARTRIGNIDTAFDCYLVLKRVVAKIQDGHTQLFDRGRLGIEELRFPYRMERFSDGSAEWHIEHLYRCQICGAIRRYGLSELKKT